MEVVFCSQLRRVQRFKTRRYVSRKIAQRMLSTPFHKNGNVCLRGHGRTPPSDADELRMQRRASGHGLDGACGCRRRPGAVRLPVFIRVPIKYVSVIMKLHT